MRTPGARALAALLVALATVLQVLCQSSTTLVGYFGADSLQRDNVLDMNYALVPSSAYFGVNGSVLIASKPGQRWTLFWGPTRTALTLLPGAVMTWAGVDLGNLLLDDAHEKPLSTGAFKMQANSTLRLQDVNIETSCTVVANYEDYACSLQPNMNLQVKQNQVMVMSWSAAGAEAGSLIEWRNVSVHCSMEEWAAYAKQRRPCQSRTVSSGVELLAGVAAMQQYSQVVYLNIDVLNITIPPTPSPVPVSANLTITGLRGWTGVADMTEIDWRMQTNVLDLSWNAHLKLQDTLNVNMPLGPPDQWPNGLLVIPFWWQFKFSRTTQQLEITRCKIVLPEDEFSWWEYWSVRLLNPLPSIQQEAWWVLCIGPVPPGCVPLLSGVDGIDQANYGGQAFTANFTSTPYSTVTSYTNLKFAPRTPLMKQQSGILSLDDKPLPLTDVVGASTDTELLAAGRRQAVGGRSELYARLVLPHLTVPVDAGSGVVPWPRGGVRLLSPMSIVGDPLAPLVLDARGLRLFDIALNTSLTLRHMVLANPWLGEDDPVDMRHQWVEQLYDYARGLTSSRPHQYVPWDLHSVTIVTDPLLVAWLCLGILISSSRPPYMPAPVADYLAAVAVVADVDSIIGNTSITFRQLRIFNLACTNVTFTATCPDALAGMEVLRLVDTAALATYITAQPSGSSSSGRALPGWAIALIVLAGVALMGGAGTTIGVLELKRRRALAALAQTLSDSAASRKDALAAVMRSRTEDERPSHNSGSAGGATAASASAVVAMLTAHAEYEAANGRGPAGGGGGPGRGALTTAANEQLPASGAGSGATGGGGSVGAGGRPVAVSRSDTTGEHRDLHDEIKDAISRMQAEMASKAATAAAHLQVLAPLGHGAFGVVYSGLWRGLKVAVKTMVVQASSDARQRERIVKEVAINASLAHPNIVPTYHYDLRPLAALSGPDGSGMDPNAVMGGGSHPHPPGGIVLSPASALDSFLPRADQVGECSKEVTIGPTPVDWKLFIVQEFCDAGTLQQAITRGWFHVGSKVNLTAPPDYNTEPAPFHFDFEDEEEGTGANGAPAGSTAVQSTASGSTVPPVLPEIDMAKVFACALDIVKGMAYIHASSIIHGDLTTNNVLLKSLMESEPASTKSGLGGGLLAVDESGGGSGFAGPPGGVVYMPMTAVPQGLPAVVQVSSMQGGSNMTAGSGSTGSGTASGQSGQGGGIISPSPTPAYLGAGGTGGTGSTTGRYTAKIADFGLSVKMDANQSHVSNLVQGTPFYVAPEVVRTAHLTKAADVYSFGVMLWELVWGGLVPRTRHNLLQCSVGHTLPCLKRPPPPGCPPALGALLASCLLPDPTTRPTFERMVPVIEALAAPPPSASLNGGGLYSLGSGGGASSRMVSAARRSRSGASPVAALLGGAAQGVRGGSGDGARERSRPVQRGPPQLAAAAHEEGHLMLSRGQAEGTQAAGDLASSGNQAPPQQQEQEQEQREPCETTAVGLLRERSRVAGGTAGPAGRLSLGSVLRVGGSAPGSGDAQPAGVPPELSEMLGYKATAGGPGSGAVGEGRMVATGTGRPWLVGADGPPAVVWAAGGVSPAAGGATDERAASARAGPKDTEDEEKVEGLPLGLEAAHESVPAPPTPYSSGRNVVDPAVTTLSQYEEDERMSGLMRGWDSVAGGKDDAGSR